MSRYMCTIDITVHHMLIVISLRVASCAVRGYCACCTTRSAVLQSAGIRHISNGEEP